MGVKGLNPSKRENILVSVGSSSRFVGMAALGIIIRYPVAVSPSASRKREDGQGNMQWAGLMFSHSARRGSSASGEASGPESGMTAMPSSHENKKAETKRRRRARSMPKCIRYTSKGERLPWGTRSVYEPGAVFTHAFALILWGPARTSLGLFTRPDAPSDFPHNRSGCKPSLTPRVEPVRPPKSGCGSPNTNIREPTLPQHAIKARAGRYRLRSVSGRSPKRSGRPPPIRKTEHGVWANQQSHIPRWRAVRTVSGLKDTVPRGISTTRQLRVSAKFTPLSTELDAERTRRAHPPR